MNKVITINLNGKAYQLEESGYDALHAYLQQARAKLDGNPDQSEIMKDFEQAIAEKCDKYLASHKNVVTHAEVSTIINDMGPVTADDGSASSEHATHADHVVKRLYRIRDGAWIAGVCQGIALYFGMDVMVVRILFIVFSLFTKGGGIGLYILMAFFVPSADTNEEKAFARGKQFNAHEFMEEMKAKYGKYAGKYAEEGYWKQYAHHQGQSWQSLRHAGMRASRFGTRIVTAIGRLILAAIAIVYSIMLWSIILHPSVFGNKFLIGASPILLALFITALALIAIIPIRGIVEEARRHTHNIMTKQHAGKRVARIVIWILAIGFAVTIGILSIPDRQQQYAPYGVDFWIAHREICIGGNYFCSPPVPLQ